MRRAELQHSAFCHAPCTLHHQAPAARTCEASRPLMVSLPSEKEQPHLVSPIFLRSWICAQGNGGGVEGRVQAVGRGQAAGAGGCGGRAGEGVLVEWRACILACGVGERSSCCSGCCCCASWL
jgi:hypothetical protein